MPDAGNATPKKPSRRQKLAYTTFTFRLSEQEIESAFRVAYSFNMSLSALIRRLLGAAKMINLQDNQHLMIVRKNPVDGSHEIVAMVVDL